MLDAADREASAIIPVLKRAGVVLIALPGSCLSEKEPAAGSVVEEVQDPGPHVKTEILARNSVEDAVVPVLVLDFPSLVFANLKVMPRSLDWPDGARRFGHEAGEQLPDRHGRSAYMDKAAQTQKSKARLPCRSARIALLRTKMLKIETCAGCRERRGPFFKNASGRQWTSSLISMFKPSRSKRAEGRIAAGFSPDNGEVCARRSSSGNRPDPWP